MADAVQHMLMHQVRIASVRSDDVSRWDVDLQGHALNECIAVHCEDLGECLAAVLTLDPPTLLWSDSDGAGTPIKDDAFVQAVATVINATTLGGTNG